MTPGVSNFTDENGNDAYFEFSGTQSQVDGIINAHDAFSNGKIPQNLETDLEGSDDDTYLEDPNTPLKKQHLVSTINYLRKEIESRDATIASLRSKLLESKKHLTFGSKYGTFIMRFCIIAMICFCITPVKSFA